MEAVSTHRLLRRPDFFFFLFFGRGDGELLDFLFTLNWPLKGGGGIKSEIESEEGKNNLQVIESTIIFPKNKILIIVICCFADKKAISVYFLISPIHSAIMQNIHAIYLTIETRNCSEEIALNLFCRAEKHNLNDHLHYDFKQK